MYKVKKYFKKTGIKTNEKLEGESIERKVERMLSNKEPIKDGAPEIFTERKNGIVSAYNIRTDRWEIAVDAMDKVQRSIDAKRMERMKSKEDKEVKVVDLKGGDVSGAKSTDGGASKEVK